LKVKQRTLELNTQLYNDNKRRAELGALAEIDIIQAEAEMKTSQQDVVTEETQVLQQEAIVKSALTRSGFSNPAVVGARIVPTDHFNVPSQDAIQPTQDLVSEAFQKRPEIEQSQVGLEDARINMLGTKNNLLPSLSVFANLSNNGLAGSVNNLPLQTTVVCTPRVNGWPANGVNVVTVVRNSTNVNGFFLGGYGTFLSQLFNRNFPNYSAGFQLNVPIRNRANQADLITDELNYRQSQIQDKQLQNNIKLNVINAQTALTQARAAYETAVQARKLQEQVLSGERRKYELGTSTILNVVIVQRDTTAREIAEVDARSQYIKSRTALDNVLGRTLEVQNVDIGEAQRGIVTREPDLIPAIGLAR
jgi:outer membrane protein TolC